jgi:putative peptidoglycan lipid II flippase
VGLFLAAHALHWPAAHVVFAVSTSLTAWINSMLLLRRLRRDGVYQPQPGWGRFTLRLLLANLALAALLLGTAGGLELWLAADKWARVVRIAWVVLAGGAVYFAVLGLCGLRPRHFRPARAHKVL